MSDYYQVLKFNAGNFRSIEAVSKHPRNQNLGGISCLMNG